MASSSKKKTTFAKITRENAVRDSRLRKQAKKDARKQEAAAQAEAPSETPARRRGVAAPRGLVPPAPSVGGWRDQRQPEGQCPSSC